MLGACAPDRLRYPVIVYHNSRFMAAASAAFFRRRAADLVDIADERRQLDPQDRPLSLGRSLLAVDLTALP